MRRIYALFIFLLFLINVNAENKAVISGRVIDATTKEVLPFANVMLKVPANENQITGTMTDNSGQFILNGIPEGEYNVNISFIGYDTKEVPILIGKLNKTFDLGRIDLKVSETSLDEITVSAKKQIVSSALDKKSFDIGSNVSQSGGSALDAMRNLPGISVNAEEQVLLRGSEKVTILIDGKQSSLTGYGNQKGLDNIPASNIESIEIINNPSAKYDSKGLAGIINIIYKKEKETGINGEVGLHVGVGELTNRQANLPGIMEKYGFNPKLNPAVSLNYRTNKLNFFLQTDGIVRSKLNTNEFTTRTYTDGSPAIVSQFLENRTQQLYNIKGGLDWYLTPNNTLTLYALFEDEYHIDRGHVPYDYISNGTRKRFWTWNEDENTRFINYAANFKHNFSQPGHTIEAGIFYTKGGEDELFSFTDSSAVRNSVDQTHLIVNEIVTNLNLDYVKPLRSGRIELGSKAQLRNIPISYKIMPGDNSILDTHLGEWSEYRENIYAAYVNLIHETNKIEIEGGLRAEQSFVSYDIDPANNYYNNNDAYNEFSLFPNVRLTYKFNPENKVSLFYNNRIDRPGEFELRPFPKYDDPEILKTGNPYLRPQYTRTFEIAYKKNWENGTMYIAGFHRLINNIFSRIYTIDAQASTSIINTIPQNLGKGTNLGFEIAFEQKITKKWNLDGSLNWYMNKINTFSGTAIYPYAQSFNFDESKSNTWNFKINNNIKLPLETDLQVSAVYYAPNIIPQGKVLERYSVDLGLKKPVFKGKGEVSLIASDLFNTFGLRQTIQGDGFSLATNNYYETQVITLGLKYKL
jgi:outer membrane receptor protein involved in Fe transport